MVKERFLLENILENKLKQYFGYSSFQVGQKAIISDVLDGNDVLGILPTGSGKSMCYQLPARLLDGTVLVISPLISLMIDQVRQLKASGFKEVIAINSFLDYTEKRSALNYLEKYKLIYVSPEMLQNKKFINELAKINISLFVIDEAHCISQWGHEFRPDYLKLDKVIKKLNRPPVMALSATATPEVQEDIITQLECPSMIKHVFPMDRDNIALTVEKFDNYNEKLEYLTELLNEIPVPTMIYFSSRNWTERAANVLRSTLTNLRVAFYHGGMEQTDRILIQQQFMNNQIDVICCTSAFGMGINKKNVRLVVHFHLPTQMESFIQEIGRAGRDGNSSVSLVLLAPNDDLLPKRLLETELPNNEQVEMTVRVLKNDLLVNRKNSVNELEITQQCQLSETQWRFLQYQFEKHGMMKEGQILEKIADCDRERIQIIRHIENRNQLKHYKLSELFSWVMSDGCRRRNLFSSFQKTINKPKFHCCDRCDFSIKEWTPSIEQKTILSVHWSEQLRLLFLQGEKNE